MAQNDGGVKRGDRADTGDLTAIPKGGRKSPEAGGALDPNNPFPEGGLEDLTFKEATDPTLGLTNIGTKEAEDWAADTGPTRSAEEEQNLTTRELSDDGSTLVEDQHVRGHSPDEGDFPIGTYRPEEEKR
ncbi:MAG TPA: hypothetical protein VE621_07755 [Bryobacteraceae bacterium]|nr:hypothetical protein [Bryobacteraceae bacterium]